MSVARRGEPGDVETAAARARDVAGTASTWEDLGALLVGCPLCPELVGARTHVVPGQRPPGARVLLVGEAPGAQEDLVGEPFVGKSGELLDRLLAEVGLSRADVAVSNVVKCRPPGNRKPRRPEVRRCRPYLERQLALLDPDVVVPLGGTAAEWFFGPGVRIGEVRAAGPTTYDGRTLVVTYHPSAAIRFGPAGAPLAALREDLALVAEILAGSGQTRT